MRVISQYFESFYNNTLFIEIAGALKHHSHNKQRADSIKLLSLYVTHHSDVIFFYWKNLFLQITVV